MTYEHRFNNSPSPLPAGKVVCVGRNHVRLTRQGSALQESYANLA